MRFFGKGKSVCVKVCMCKLSQLSKFLHRRRRKKSLSKFRTKSSVNTSIASRFQPTVVAALKSQAASKDKSLPGFLTAGSIASHIKPIAYLIVGYLALGYVSAQTIGNALRPLWQRSSRVRTS